MQFLSIEVLTKRSTKGEGNINYGELERDPLIMIVTEIAHAVYEEEDGAHHVHGLGEVRAHDGVEGERGTYGDVGVAGLAVFKQDLVNLPGKEVSIGSIIKYFSSHQIHMECSILNNTYLFATLLHMLLVVKIPYLP